MEDTLGERVERFEAEAARLRRRSSRIAQLRLVTFLGGAGALLATLGAVAGWPRPALYVTAGIAFAVYGLLVHLHDRVIRAEGEATGLVAVGREALARRARRWQDLPAGPSMTETSIVAAPDPVARDLDLFSSAEQSASLAGLLCTAETPMGRETTARWLCTPAAPQEVARRQEAVRELGPALAFRQRFQVAARAVGRRAGSVEPFLAWAEAAPWVARPGLWVGLARAATAMTLGLLVAHLLGWTRPWWILVAIANLLLGALLGRLAHETYDQVGFKHRAFRAFGPAFGPLESTVFEADRLTALRARLRVNHRSAARQMQRLDRILGYADARRSGLLYLLLQGLLLWDLHVLAALGRWQREVGPAVRGWFTALGEAEALAALAAVHYEHPEWAFPAILSADADAEPRAPERRLRAAQVGHPLLPPEHCVRNDLQVGPPGTFLLVTGSNMSGKSTLLRAIGLNVILAQAGGVVCAREWSMPPVRLGTSFRVQDSIEHGVSFFLAELRRLKTIVEEAQETSARGDATYLFLLDEILLGTNVYERQIAVRRVLGHLVSQDAIGAISTHDLTLAEVEELAEAAQPVHFTEQYTPGDGEEPARMDFDYRLRAGVAPTTNALKLLTLVGLGESPEPPS